MTNLDKYVEKLKQNLTEEEQEQLLNLLRKADEKKVGKRKRAEKYGNYWFVGTRLEVVEQLDIRGTFDDIIFYENNYFLTKEDAEFEAEKRKVKAELEIFALENNEEGFNKISTDHEKYYIQYYIDDNSLVVNYFRHYINDGQTLFSSEEIANAAIKAIGEDRIKKYLFGVEG